MREYDELVKALRHCAAYDCTTKCPRAGTGNGCVSGLKREAADAIEELLALAQNGASAIDITNRLAQKVEELLAKDTNVPDKDVGKWISVEDELPKKGTVVLAFGTRSATTGMFQGVGTAPWFWWWKGHTIKRVTHWMPLPSMEGLNET